MPGVFAIGDCNSDNSTNVPHAMFSGKKAAVFAHGMFSFLSPTIPPCCSRLTCATVEMAKEESNAAIDKRDDDLVKEVEKRMGNDMEKIYNRARGL